MKALPIIAAGEHHEPWLRYTLDVLTGLAGLAVPLVLTKPDQAPAEGPRIFYGVLPAPGADALWIPRLTDAGDFRTTTVQLEYKQGRSTDIVIYADTIDPETKAPDILFNLFAHISCLAEHEHEKKHGPIHSYAFHLGRNWRRFERPHANLLALAFRRRVETFWSAGVAPLHRSGAIHLSHDVDATEKTVRTRLKEGTFCAFNTLRHVRHGRWHEAAGTAGDAFSMIAGDGSYDTFDQIAGLEAEFDVRSSFNVYCSVAPAGTGATLRRLIFDPAYRLDRNRGLIQALRELHRKGFEIGVHFAFDTWRDAGRMAAERAGLERTLKTGPVTSCRQHWLRFSLADTWRAQAAAGIRVDTSLGFNDRPGFRAGMAAAYRPFDHAAGRAHDVVVVPTALMDTQLFRHRVMNRAERRQEIRRLLEEIADVSGEACVIWHSHVFSADYGWSGDYEYILSTMRDLGLAAALPRERQAQLASSDSTRTMR